MNKPPVPTFTSIADIRHEVMKMDGPWWVWSDSVEPLLKDVDYDTMKKYVDAGHARGQLDLYGDNTDSDITYEGDEA
jgi:hypothetical protein